MKPRSAATDRPLGLQHDAVFASAFEVDHQPSGARGGGDHGLQRAQHGFARALQRNTNAYILRQLDLDVFQGLHTRNRKLRRGLVVIRTQHTFHQDRHFDLETLAETRVVLGETDEVDLADRIFERGLGVHFS